MPVLRAILVMSGFFLLMAVLIPIQWLALKTGWHLQRSLPVFFHRTLSRILGLRVHLEGEPLVPGPLLIAGNHLTWLDIVPVSMIGPLSFISKGEVANWPVFGLLAKLQRTIFIDRDRRSAVAAQRLEIEDRLTAGECLVLFPEGTTGTGNRVLPFKSSLFGAVQNKARMTPVVQPMSIAYTRVHGLPLGRSMRPKIAWYGDMDMIPHLISYLLMGPVDVTIRLGRPLDPAAYPNRKMLTAAAQLAVEEGFAEITSDRRWLDSAAHAGDRNPQNPAQGTHRAQPA